MGKKKAKVNVAAERKRIEEEYSYLKEASLPSYIWEFIRRNKRYREFYEQYASNTQYWDAPVYIESVKGAPFHAPRYFQSIVVFGLKLPIDPSEICVNGLIKGEPISKFFWDDTFNDELIYEPGIDDDMMLNVLDQKGFVPPNNRSLWQALHPFSMHVYIDITVDFEQIQDRLEQKIQVAQQRILGIIEENASKNESRRRFTEWTTYLQAYDLNKEKGYGPITIVEILLPPAEIEANIHAADYPGSKKIHRFIKSAEKLINSGYSLYLNQASIKEFGFDTLREPH